MEQIWFGSAVILSVVAAPSNLVLSAYMLIVVGSQHQGLAGIDRVRVAHTFSHLHKLDVNLVGKMIDIPLARQVSESIFSAIEGTVMSFGSMRG